MPAVPLSDDLSAALGRAPGVVVLVDGSAPAHRAVEVAAAEAGSGGLHLVWPFCIRDVDRPPGSLHLLPSVTEYCEYLGPYVQALAPDGAVAHVVWMRNREKLFAQFAVATLLVVPRGDVHATLRRITDRQLREAPCPVREVR